MSSPTALQKMWEPEYRIGHKGPLELTSENALTSADGSVQEGTPQLSWGGLPNFLATVHVIGGQVLREAPAAAGWCLLVSEPLVGGQQGDDVGLEG